LPDAKQVILIFAMNIIEYKEICRRPNVFRRDVLEDTEQFLSLENPSLAIYLREILSANPISKPTLHSGDESTDYFQLSLSVNLAEKIADVLIDAEVAAIGINGETTAKASRCAALVDTWTNYIESLETEKT
jgi:hypothetical protein